MEDQTDMDLLRQYAGRNSDTAFAALVSRHVNLVYSAALRKTGNPDAAEEITQAVFVILAQKAGRIPDRTILPGWLYQTARLTALSFLKSEIRRARREQEAFMQTELNHAAPDETWAQLAPLLDDAMGDLNEKERAAVVLRFFGGKSFAEVATASGVSENAAKKRVGRALEKLHHYFSRRGVSSTTAIIAGAISANSVQVAPAALAKSVTAVAIAKGAAASSSTLTLIKGALKIMAWTKAKTAIVVGVAAILAVTSTTIIGTELVKAHRENNRFGLNDIWDIQPDGTVYFQVTIRDKNHTSEIIQHEYDTKTGAAVHVDQIRDEHGYPVAFDAKESDKYNRVRYAFALDKPIPPEGRIVYTLEGTITNSIQPMDDSDRSLPPFLQPKTSLVQPTGEPGVYQFLLADQPGGVNDIHRVEVYKLPAGATLLDKTPSDSHVTTNHNRVELRVDRIVPPTTTRWEVSFRYRLGATAK